MENELTAEAVVPAQHRTELPPGFYEMVDDLKSIVRGAHLRAQLKVNTEMLQMYWEIGRTILERQGAERWGTKVVGRIATELRTEFPDQRGFGARNLQYMQQTARTWPEQFAQQAAAQLPWGHLQLLMDKCKTRFELDFYAQHAVYHGWSRDRLTTHIRSGLHLAQGAAANNFDVTIPEQSEAATQIFKDPYRLEFTQLSDTAAERELEDALTNKIIQFLTELGFGFAFVGRQYPLTVGDTEFRIDLLFYHFRLHRFVVVELKTTRAHPSHLGQLSFYVTAVDRLLRDPERDDRTLGILIAESQDATTVEFALRSQNQPLAVSTYAGLPPGVRALMPTTDDLSRIAREVLHGGPGPE
ncbi:PDDEXK nuclease domain-containing protein [Streptomyces sp. NBC_01208]|uniref:PDDEXK nuclease domain-containing protein n=1 Tax=Streptomyces sp. NBC_01208 TaxID=2903773 RepID=UPI002E140E49|nr:PDDEXK nuclease domain-containing protein [Streptomyces sp. NBC_01208]